MENVVILYGTDATQLTIINQFKGPLPDTRTVSFNLGFQLPTS